MQFLPSTWRRWGVDASGDGVADPMNPADAIYSAARYLQAAGIQKDVRRGLWAYNPLASYVNMVLSIAARLPADYGETARSTSARELAWRACPPSSSPVRSSRTTCAAARAPRRARIVVHQWDGVEVVLPARAPANTAEQLVRSHSAWLLARLAERPAAPPSPRRDGTEIPWRGGTLRRARAARAAGVRV